MEELQESANAAKLPRQARCMHEFAETDEIASIGGSCGSGRRRAPWGSLFQALPGACAVDSVESISSGANGGAQGEEVCSEDAETLEESTSRPGSDAGVSRGTIDGEGEPAKEGGDASATS